LGITLKELGRLREAETSYRHAILLDSSYTEAHYNLANILQKFGSLEEAEKSYRRAIALKSNFAEAYNNLGATLQKLDRLTEAEESYRQAITLKPDYAEAHNNLGTTLQKLDRLTEAEASFRSAITLNSEYFEAYKNLGATLQQLGKLTEAESTYRRVTTLKSDYAEAHLYLAMIKKFDKKDTQFLQMLSLSLDKSCSMEQHTHLSFALAKASEDLGDFENSFKYYKRGNALRKKLLKYDISQDIELFKQLQTYHPRIEEKSLKSENLSNELVPIFIVGMPRSGTTLAEQIISSHSKVTGAGELPFVAKFGGSIARGSSKITTESLLNFRKAYLKKLQNYSQDNQIIIDKMPHNFLYIGLLTAAFPDAKIINVKRNSSAVCWSNFKQFFLSKTLGYSFGLDDVVTYYTLYKEHMAFWEKQLPSRIYNLDYEELTISKETEIKKLILYLNLDWEKECLSPQNNRRGVTTASNLQVREKIYQGSSQK